MARANHPRRAVSIALPVPKSSACRIAMIPATSTQISGTYQVPICGGWPRYTGPSGGRGSEDAAARISESAWDGTSHRTYAKRSQG